MNNKVLDIKSLSQIPIDNLLQLYRRGYKIEELSFPIINKLNANCQSTSKVVGQTVTMSASPSNGTPPYTINFYKDGNLLNSQSNVAENQTASYAYTTTNSDIGNRNFSVNATDSCSSGAKTSPSDLCTITVSSIAPPPSQCIPQQGEICIPGIGAVKSIYVIGAGAGILALMLLR